MTDSMPSSWSLPSLEEIADISSGVGFPKEFQGQASGDLPFYKVGDISYAVANTRGLLSETAHFVSYAVASQLGGKPVPAGATVFAKIGEAIRLNRRAFVTTPSLLDNNVMSVKARADELDRYIHYFLRTIDFSTASRATTVPSLRKGDVELLRLPLAPLSEQKRIADKLDVLLARVAACRERLNRVTAILKHFRQSILLAAISGTLTEDWRTTAPLDYSGPAGELNFLHNKWIESRIELIATVGTGSTPLRSAEGFFASKGKPWITSAATSNEFVYEASEFVTDSAIKAHRLKIFPVGTLLVAMYGEGKTRGQVTELAIEATVNQACAAIVVDESKALQSFVKLSLQANYLQMRDLAEGGNQPNLNLTKIKEFPLRLPPLNEQHEIVRRAAHLFSRSEKLEATLKSARSKIDSLTPSLLAKAFRGELVPQDPNDEPASVLLKRLAAGRDGDGGKVQVVRGRRPSKTK